MKSYTSPNAVPRRTRPRLASTEQVCEHIEAAQSRFLVSIHRRQSEQAGKARRELDRLASQYVHLLKGATDEQ